MPEPKILAVGVAESKRLPGVAVLFQAVAGKGGALKGHFRRVFPVPGDPRSFDLGPAEFAERYRVVGQHRVQ